jgi:hypothetical protein
MGGKEDSLRMQRGLWIGEPGLWPAAMATQSMKTPPFSVLFVSNIPIHGNPACYN